MASLIGTAINSYGEAETGIANRNAGNFNAAVDERNATLATQQGDAEALMEARRGEKRLGAMRANYGASGVTVEGSAMDVLENSASDAKLNEQNIKYNAHLKSIGFSENAILDRYRAHYMLTASQYAASGTLLSGGAKAYEQRDRSTPDTGTPVSGSFGSTPSDNVATSEYGATYDSGDE